MKKICEQKLCILLHFYPLNLFIQNLRQGPKKLLWVCPYNSHDTFLMFFEKQIPVSCLQTFFEEIILRFKEGLPLDMESCCLRSRSPKLPWAPGSSHSYLFIHAMRCKSQNMATKGWKKGDGKEEHHQGANLGLMLTPESPCQENFLQGTWNWFECNIDITKSGWLLIWRDGTRGAPAGVERPIRCGSGVASTVLKRDCA